MNAEERWKRLKEWIEKDVQHCKTMIDKEMPGIIPAYGWVLARETERDILDEMARLEKGEL